MDQVKFAERQPLKNLKFYMVGLGRPYYFKFFKGCLPQFLIGQVLVQLEIFRRTTC